MRARRMRMTRSKRARSFMNAVFCTGHGAMGRVVVCMVFGTFN